MPTLCFVPRFTKKNNYTNSFILSEDATFSFIVLTFASVIYTLLKHNLFFRSDILVMPVQASKSPEKKSGASASTGASPTAESTVTQPVTIAAVSVTIDASSGERLLWYRPSDLASGHYLPYVSEEWEQSEDGEWERVLESLFKACEDWIRKPHNISGRNGKKTLKIPPGAYTSSSTVLKTMILRSSSGGGKLRSKTILQSATPKAQNCVVASISNCIYVLVEGKDYADTLKAKMRREIDATENVRGPWPKCGDTVEQLSEGVAKVCFKKTFLQNSKTARVDMAFFFSEDPASYGCFVVQVTTKDGSHDHVLAFIRNDMDNNANNYIVDSNPLNGSFALPFTKQQLDKIDAVGIHFAVKIVLKDGK